MKLRISALFSVRHEFWLQLAVYVVGIHGLFVVAITLVDQLSTHTGGRVTDIDIDIPLLIGLGLLYLSTLLRRRKRTAWVVALLAYIFMLGFYAHPIQAALTHHDWLQVIGKLGLPLLNIGLLVLYRNTFTVKSDIRSFGYALRFIALALVTAFLYGTAGFILMDQHDFHHEIGVGDAMHRTVDQFGLTTNTANTSHSRRAQVFEDSLSVVSVGALVYAAISLFQPIRARYSRHGDNLAVATELLHASSGHSEDFFKIWPQDKTYHFNKSLTAGLAYKVQSGVALVVGDPFGEKQAAGQLLKEFEDFCYGNDWQPVFVHTEPEWSSFYERHGFSMQKLGEEAILDLQKFADGRKNNKYFRQIRNKFQREQYTTEVLSPPHADALVERLRVLSDDWLQRPGRAERGFIMGYFSEAYLQQCTVVVARDAAGTIQGFLNQIPSFDPEEANFDLLRFSSASLGNMSDFLLLTFIDHLYGQGVQRLNLGLCPLAGLDDVEEKSVIGRGLEFIYSNGDRFYSFSGLRRFKAKYGPSWSDRYIVYKGSSFLAAPKIINALTRAMRVKLK